ncbi:sigma 54-interacting transcriptional regulator [Rhodopseudomonas palustris]|nr:sigma 54-interacting transcriptional regulator [Rhodopseudomonas palustris]
MEEVESLTLKLENENHYLREDLRTELGFEKIIGHSKKLKAVLLAAKQVASTDATVLVLGETGTGKGLIAHAIHQMSARKDKSFITVNCAALPHNLIESELFGREKGAFTGADIRQNGRFEVANRGTIFLDGIGEMPLELQAKLLRVLQDGEFERLACPKTIKVDVRVISATARDLKEQVRNGSFREDLFYRLNVFPVTLPPLRQRVEDIPQLTQYFMEKYTKKFGSQIDSIPNTVLKKLMHYDWPGNIRELEHLIEKSVIISPGRSLILDDKLDSSIATPSPNEKPKKDLAAVERSHILQILQSTDWRIEGADGAAAILGLHPSTMRYRLKKLGIRRPS